MLAKQGHDSAVKHTTGDAWYIGDDIADNALYVAFAAADCACGTITGIDTSAAQTMPGVVRILSAGDIPGHNDIGPLHKGDDPLLAENDVRFYGQPVCLVVATEHKIARKAAKCIVIEVDQQEPIIHLDDALVAGCEISEEHVMSTGSEQHQAQQGQQQIQGSIAIGGQEHFYLEGQIAVARFVEGDELMIQSSTQHPAEVQKIAASVLNLPIHQVQVEVRRMGGAFGGKESQASQWASAAALAAWYCRVPVVCRLDRDDDMVMTGKRHELQGQYDVVVDGQGCIESVQMAMATRCGHSLDLSDAISDRALFHADNAYHFPNARIACRRMRTNSVSNTAFRGFGGPQGMMVCEEMIDAIARTLGEDPLTIRKCNLYQQGQSTPYHMPIGSLPLATIIEQLETDSHYWQRREAIQACNASQSQIKKGLALTPVKFGISFTTTFLNQAGALLHIYRDGSISLNHGGTEMGQGLFAKVAEIVAREFGVCRSRIAVTATRTDKVPNTSPTAASSGTDMNGMAAMNAARIIKRRLIAFVCEHFIVNEEDVRFADSQVHIGNQCLSFAELAELAYLNRVHLSTTGYYRTPEIFYDRDTASGTPFYYFACGAAVSEVAIDTLTGESRVLGVDIVHDVGRTIDQAIDMGQIEGGFIQGMGWLTSEELVWDQSGRLRTHSPSTYKIPTCTDRPEHFSINLLDSSLSGRGSVHGSKAVGEPPLMLAISVFRAISDAISAVTDYHELPRLDSPATPERILAAVRDIRNR